MREAIKSLILLVVGLGLLPLGLLLIASLNFENPGKAVVLGLAGIFVFMSAFAIVGAGLSSAMTGARFGNRGQKSNIPSRADPPSVTVYLQTMLQVKEEKDAMEAKPKDEEHPPATRH